MISNNDMIAWQAKAIFAIQQQRDHALKAIQAAQMKLICIGGPLNDNKLKFNPEQQTLLRAIMNDLDDAEVAFEESEEEF